MKHKKYFDFFIHAMWETHFPLISHFTCLEKIRIWITYYAFSVQLVQITLYPYPAYLSVVIGTACTNIWGNFSFLSSILNSKLQNWLPWLEGAQSHQKWWGLFPLRIIKNEAPYGIYYIATFHQLLIFWKTGSFNNMYFLSEVLNYSIAVFWYQIK